MDRVKAGGRSIHVWRSFHNNSKSSLVPRDSNANGLVYRDILRDTLVPFARLHFGANFHYQDDNATPHDTRVVIAYPPAGRHHTVGPVIKIPRRLQLYTEPLG